MFKGFDQRIKDKIEKVNQTSGKFVFCVSDLQPSSDGDKNRFDIHSEELRQKLGQIIVAGGGTLYNPRGIVFSELLLRIKKYGIKNK